MARIGPYEITGEVARGGMGAVYSVRDPASEHELALKVVLLDSEKARRRFEREADALSRLRHRHIVPVHATGVHDGHPYLVMDLMRGGSLQDVLNRSGPFDCDQAAEVIAKLAQAVAHAHAQGILHRDLKPANVLLSETGEPKLRELGLAKDLALDRSRLSLTGAALGTPGYWSPEQATGKLETVGPASDVYGLGSTLYALLTHSPPFDEGNLGEQIVALTSRRPEPPSKLNPAVDRGLERIVLRCLEKDPSARYPSAGDLADALDAWTRSESGPARGPLASALVGVVLALLALLIGYGLTRRPAAPPSPSPSPSPASVAVPDVAPIESAAEAPPGPLPPTVAERLRAVKAHLARGESSAALELLNGLISENPHQLQARLVRGTLFKDQQRYGDALIDFDAATRIDPEHHMGYWGRAISQHSLGDLAAALRDCELALGLDPDNPGIFHSRGLVHEALGNYEQAVSDLREALRRTPEDADSRALTEKQLDSAQRMQRYHALREAAAQAFEEGNAPLADHQFAQAIGLMPDEPAAYYARGVARREWGDPVGALADLDRCLQLDPGSGVAWYIRGLVYHDAKDYAQAILSFNKAVQCAPEMGQAHLMRGVAMADTSDNLPPPVQNQVLGDLRRAMELLVPGSPDYRRAQEVLDRFAPPGAVPLRKP